MKPFISIDFEFFNSNDYRPEQVCCSVHDQEIDETKTFWLLNDDDEEKANLVEYIRERKESHIFLGYMCVAEARSCLALDIEDIKEFEFIDLYCEWAMLINHNDELCYGKQLIDGREVTTYAPKPKWEQTAKDEKRNKAKAQRSLAACCSKLIGVKVDTDRKTEMRNIIISGDEEAIEANREEIVEYCESDIEYLPRIYTKMMKHYKKLYSFDDYTNMLPEMLYRGNYAVRTAYIERLGESINTEWAQNFSDSVPFILRDIQREINDLFPDIRPFRFNKKDATYSWNQIKTKEWIETLDKDIVKGWMKTPKKAISLKLDAFLKFFNFHHDFPKDSLGAQMVRYLKMKQNLNGFLPSKKGKKTFFDSIGSDGRSRPFLGIYGSQSGRNQPGATGFLFLKSAWMRALAQPPRGRVCVDIDFGSEEFLIGGLESQDLAMVEAYHSGDPYLYFAKAAGAVPQEGTKKSHPQMRNKFKSTCLGLSYGMRAKGLAIKLTVDTGIYHTPEMAQELIDLFEKVFPRYTHYRNVEILELYDTQKYLKLSDGWTLFGDNPNNLSVSNFPSQGKGSVVLREMVTTLQDLNLDLNRTLHDAGYIEIDWGDWDKMDVFYQAMYDSFYNSYKGHPLQEHARIRLDIEAWGPDFAELVNDKGHYILTTPAGLEVPCQEIYIDGRATKEYEYFSKYFLESSEERLGGL